MAKDRFVQIRDYRSELIRIGLPLPQMRHNLELSLTTDSRNADIYQVVPWGPTLLISIRVNRARTEANVLRITSNPLSMLVPEHMDRCSTAYGIVCVVLVHEPIRRMMNHD